MLIALGILLSSCAMQMTREESNRHYDDCVEDGGGRAGKVFVCLLAIHSGNYSGKELANLYFMKGIHQQNGGEFGKSVSDFSKALKINPDDAEAYFYRGWSLRELGQLERAQDDFDKALSFGYNRDYQNVADETRNRLRDEYAQEAASNRPVSLMFNGFYCPKVQNDSVFYPANEIHIDVIVTDSGGGYQSWAFPTRTKVYKGIKAGSRRNVSKRIWQGQDQPLSVQVVVWEYDDGGPLVESLTEIAVDFALTRGSKTLSKAAVKRGVNATAARGGRYAAKQAMEQLDLSGQLSQSISSLPKALVGANNDLVGAIGVTGLSWDSLGSASSGHGFNYHFYTRHRRGGADCRVYFQFVE